MKNDNEIGNEQMASELRASMGGATLPTTARSSAIVVEDENGNPKVKRRWKIGDPWTDSYFFADWRTGESE